MLFWKKKDIDVGVKVWVRTEDDCFSGIVKDFCRRDGYLVERNEAWPSLRWRNGSMWYVSPSDLKLYKE